MDGSSFDQITRRLALTTTRRGGIASLVAGALGIAGISAADAVVPVPPICRSTGSECTDGAQCCSGRCIAKRLKNGGGSRCARKTSNRKKKKKKEDSGDETCVEAGAVCGETDTCCDGACYLNTNDQTSACKTCGDFADSCEFGPCCPGMQCISNVCYV